jgi:peptidoglycan hydrolase CwlO-like protein
MLLLLKRMKVFNALSICFKHGIICLNSCNLFLLVFSYFFSIVLVLFVMLYFCFFRDQLRDSKQFFFFCFFFFTWSDTDEELKEWKTKFEERIALLESKISKLEREMNDTETKSSFLKRTINEYIWEISKLQTEAEVILFFFFLI